MATATLETYRDRNEWLESRRNGLGASDAAVVLGVSPWKTPHELWLEKTGKLPPQDQPDVPDDPMSWGLALEPVLRAVYEKKTGRTVSTDPADSSYRNNDHPFLTASLDCHVIDTDRGEGVGELKTTNPFGVQRWRDDGPPIQYLCQVQHAMLVTGLSWASIATFFSISVPMRIDDIDRNDSFIETMLELETKFWESVQTDEPPPIDADHASTPRLIERLYPRDDGTTIDLPTDAETYVQQWTMATTMANEAKALKTEAQNQLKTMLGEATIGMLPDGRRVKWAVVERKEHLVKASSSRQMRLLNAPKK